MKVRGLVHVHSTISFDGTLTLRQLHELAVTHGFGFAAITEHIEGLHEGDLARLIADCDEASSSECLLIPGLEIEEQCQYFLGMSRPVSTLNADETRRLLLANGAIAVLAHPHRMKRPLTAEERSSLDAIEIWNVKDDGSRVPGYVGYTLWRQWSTESPENAPGPIAGVDLHKAADFRPIGIEVDVAQLDGESILAEIRTGRFVILDHDRKFDPHSVSRFDLLLSCVIWKMRSMYRRFRIKRMMPSVFRLGLRRLLKG